MKIVIDIDGIIALGGAPFKNCYPVYPIIGKIKYLKNRGHKIILFTSRRESDREITKSWLKKHEVRYDKLMMGKPLGDVYLDDRNINLPKFLMLR